MIFVSRWLIRLRNFISGASLLFNRAPRDRHPVGGEYGRIPRPQQFISP
jgi:hypothetical protein